MHLPLESLMLATLQIFSLLVVVVEVVYEIVDDAAVVLLLATDDAKVVDAAADDVVETLEFALLTFSRFVEEDDMLLPLFANALGSFIVELL